MNFQVDADRVTSTAHATQSNVSALYSEANTMLRNLLSLEECWKGAAAQNFHSIVNQWEGAQRQLFESLNSIQTALGTAARQYEEVESANTRLFAP